MEREEILVIECMSSAIMYVDEIIDRGYKAFVVNPTCGNDHLMQLKHKIQSNFESKYSKDQYECVYADNNAQAIFDMCEGHNIICAVAGSEYGVKTIDDVAFMLGVKGNNPKTNYCRCTKLGMIESLNHAGLRAIKTARIEKKQDIVNFFNENKLDRCFMKFSEGAGSYGNKTCSNLDDAIKYFDVIMNSKDYFGDSGGDVLAQEVIEGTEYVVNTVTCKGNHKVTDIWRYKKVTTENGDMIYDTSTLVDEITDEIKELIDYSFKVADAVGVKYGPIHGEYKIDKQGPVLIETNCRPMGDSTTREYARDVAGNCIVDWSLDAYLDEDAFKKHSDDYHIVKNAIKKYIILKHDITGDMGSGFFSGEHLKSYHNHNDYEPVGICAYEATKDLGNTPMILKLAHVDKEQLKHDIDLMHFIEDEFMELLVCPHPNVPAGEQPSIEDIVSGLENNTERTLVLTNKDAYEVCDGKYCPVGDQTNPVFDNILYADCSASLLVDKFEEMWAMFKYLKPQGKAICSDAVAKMLPYGNDCFEILKKVANI
ncbi:MAG: ATP-grasp domain-containing protein [Coriobacteriia bacterium]|nr:ATP-grasp domain-containing protein [Coriobacteriia bacterium]